MRTRSPRLASAIADLLNGETVERAEIDDPSPVPRYSVVRNHSNRGGAALFAESTARDPSKFGYGFVARASDADLLDRVAAMLNAIEPHLRPRVTRGFGWW